MFPIRATDRSQITQGYGKTPFASTPQGAALYAGFGGIHPGIDIGTFQVNLECLATVSGKIVRAGWDGGWGNHTEILGDDGWNRQYAHQLSVTVKVGDMVKAGDVIGRVGTTGGYWKITATGKVWVACSTGIHLHYGNRKLSWGKWQYRDPSGDFQGTPVPATAVMPGKKFIKSTDPKSVGIYFYDGEKKYPITTWDTFKVLSGGTSLDAVELVGDDVLSKIPEGQAFPALSVKLFIKQ